MTQCYAKGCKNTSANGVKMCFFPKDPERKALWTNICKKFDATTTQLPNNFSALCEYHFTTDSWEKPGPSGRKRLKHFAEPSIFGDLVSQVYGNINSSPAKVGYSNTNKILVRTNPNTEDIQQILTHPDQHSKLLLVDGQTDGVKKPRIVSNTMIKGPALKRRKQIPSNTNEIKNLFLNGNVISLRIEDLPSKDNKSIAANVSHPNPEEISYGNGYKQEENNDSDSFVAENFEPITDDEIDNHEEVNADLAANDGIDPINVNKLQGKGQIVYNIIAKEEHNLHCLQAELAKTDKSTERKCNRCDRIEKVYIKSERLRTMMKKNCKKQHRNLKRRIQMLENQVQVLEGSQTALRHLFNQDQIDFLCKNPKKVAKWSESTMEKAYLYRKTFGRDGYQLLIDHNWPLPSLKTLRNREERQIKKNFEAVDDQNLIYIIENFA